MSEAMGGLPRKIGMALASGEIDEIRHVVANLTTSDQELLEFQLGRDAVQRMQRHARRSRTNFLGRVVVTHGMLGSDLTSAGERGKPETIWVNLRQLSRGRFADFLMDVKGRTKNDVHVKGIRVEYLPLILELSARWDVLIFGYDWRESFDKSASHLNTALAGWAKGQPSHIVAHSAGGLVARRFIQQFGERWASMNDQAGTGEGGRLIMLGTPNHGSLAATQLLSGSSTLIKWLEVIDKQHSERELQKVICSFHSLYQMLPSPLLNFGDDRKKLALPKHWGRVPITQELLDLGLRFQREIAGVVDPQRMIYVAGCNQKTPFRIRVVSPGEFDYSHTLSGDGHVSHDLGLLEGVPTYWLSDTHGGLPRNDRLLEGMHDLLRIGRTDALESHRPRTRAFALTEYDWETRLKLNQIANSKASVEAIASGIRSAKSRTSERDSALLEATLVEDYVGGTRGAARSRVDRKPGVSRGARRRPRKLRVEIHCGDIEKADADVYAAGHYVGVEPQNAELALDCAVSGIKQKDVNLNSRLAITGLTRRGVIKGQLGDINFYPFSAVNGMNRVAAIAGMGPMGTFGRRQLVRLAESLTSSTGFLPNANTLCMVLIGAGVGGLRVPVAAEAILEGVVKAIGDTTAGSPISTLKLVERQYGRALELQDALTNCRERIAKQNSSVQLEISSTPTRGMGAMLGTEYALALALSGLSLATSDRGRRGDRAAVAAIVESLGLPRLFKKQVQLELSALAAPGPSKERLALSSLARRLGLNLRRTTRPDREVPTRLSVTWDGTNVVIAALTDVAVVPERVSRVQKSLIDEAVLRMINPDVEAIGELGRKMNLLLLPRDFRDILLEANGPVIFEVDREMAKVHWEMFAQDANRSADGTPLGLSVQVARQLRTAYSAVPARELPNNGQRLRALVIGDPGDPALGHDLRGARQEAMEVATTLELLGVDVKLMLGASDSPNGEQFNGAPIPNASMFDALGELMNGGYDILHYCGHGDFDANDPTGRSGWLFKGGLLTARELERVDVAPRLVVANACLSSRISNITSGSKITSRLDADLLPSLADEFFRRGVRNYVGTAWEVDDLGAIEFAKTLYSTLLADAKPLGEAMLKARQVLFESRARYGSLWAAYQHYGSPDFQLSAAPAVAMSETTPGVPSHSRRSAPPRRKRSPKVRKKMKRRSS